MNARIFALKSLCCIMTLVLMSCLSFAEPGLSKQRFISTKARLNIFSNTRVVMPIAQSSIACAMFCSITETCCSASYNEKSTQCGLDQTCCPQSDSSEEGIVMRKTNESVSLLCPCGWTLHESKCYFFSEDTAIWKNSKTACEAHGSNLAEVKTDSTRNFLRIKAAEYRDSAEAFWIGLTDIDDNGVWIWSSSQTEATVTDWYHTQPTMVYQLKEQNCVFLFRKFGYKWNDAYCEDECQYVCEKTALQI